MKLARKLQNYLSMVKFAHTVFAMPFALIGFFLAIEFSGATFDPKEFLLVILCMVFARNAAMGFNRYVDREIDSKNPRTAIREIPQGIIKPKSALRFVILNAILFVVAAGLINQLTFILSPIALLVVLGYSLTKKYTALCHFILGFGLSLAPIGAYLAVTGKFELLPLLFSFIVLFWVAGFDVIYALQDEKFDKEEALKSIPVWLGKKSALMLSMVLHVFTAGIVLFVGFLGDFGTFYWLGSTVFLGLLFYQHTIVTPKDLSKVNLAFFTTNGIASVLFSVFFILDVYVS
ncbi:MAG: UbiA-like polyprenyltransferase [Bacteroidota bacterium]